MSWDVFNALPFGSKPRWLLRVTIGAVAYHYSIGNQVITPVGKPAAEFTGSTTWLKSGIGVGPINDSGVQQKRVVRVTFPKALSVTPDLLALNRRVPVRIDLWQSFVGDPDDEYRRQFLGYAKQRKPRFTGVVLECFDDLETFNNQALSRAVQRPCPYAVYDASCMVPRAAHRVAGNANALSGLVVTVPEAASAADGTYNAGLLEYGSLEQRIRTHVGTQLTLHAPITGLADEITNNGSAAVNLLPGCLKSFNICDTRFNNTINHGGFEEISTSPYDGNGIL